MWDIFVCRNLRKKVNCIIALKCRYRWVSVPKRVGKEWKVGKRELTRWDGCGIMYEPSRERALEGAGERLRRGESGAKAKGTEP